MHLAPETVSLKNGKTAFLRSAEPGDAAAMIDYLKAAAGETPFLLRYPDEVVLTEEDERRFLQGRLNDPSGILLNAWMDGALAANGIWSVAPWFWCLVIGGLIVLWILIGIRNLGKINTAAMLLLFVLTLVLFNPLYRVMDKLMGMYMPR